MRILALTALVGALAASSSAAPRPQTVLRTQGTVARLAADGKRVALAATGIPKTCDRIVLWDARTSKTTTWSTGVHCPGGGTSGGQSVAELALAGTRVAWVERVAGNLEDLTLDVATPGAKKRLVAFAENGGGAAGEPDGDYLGNVFGHGSTLAFNTWNVCALVPVGAEDDTARPCAHPPAQLPAEEQHVPASERLWGLGAAKTLVRAAPDVLRVVGVDAGRIAVQQTNGTVTVFGSGGARKATIAVPAGTTAGTVFQGSDVVTLRNGVLEEYDVSNGKLVATAPAAERGAQLRDVQNGVAVYVEGTRVHVVRLADGKRATVKAPGRAPVDAQLEAPGLYYSYNVVTGTSRGRVAFLPSGRLRTLLR